MMEVYDMTIEMSDQVFFENLNLKLSPGDELVVKGPAGVGKSQLFYCMTGIYVPKYGQVRFDGVDVHSSLENINVRKKFGTIFQIPALISNQNVDQNIELVIDHFFPDIQTKEKQDWLSNILKEFGLELKRKLRPAELSVGERYQLSLARGIFMKPKVLLWDGAYDHLDYRYKKVAQNMIKEILNDGGIVVYFTNEELDFKGSNFKYLTWKDGSWGQT